MYCSELRPIRLRTFRVCLAQLHMAHRACCSWASHPHAGMSLHMASYALEEKKDEISVNL